MVELIPVQLTSGQNVSNHKSRLSRACGVKCGYVKSYHEISHQFRKGKMVQDQETSGKLSGYNSKITSDRDISG